MYALGSVGADCGQYHVLATAHHRSRPAVDRAVDNLSRDTRD